MKHFCGILFTVMLVVFPCTTSSAQDLDERYVIVLLDDPVEESVSSYSQFVAQADVKDTLSILSDIEEAEFPDNQSDPSYRQLVLESAGAAVLPITSGKYSAVTEKLVEENIKFIPSYVRELPDFKVVAPLFSAQSANARYPELTWGVEKINAHRVWDDFSLTGSGQRIAVIDSGFYSSSRLAPWFRNSKVVLDKSNDFFGPKRSTDDVSLAISPQQGGHGTHVAGTIVGQQGLGVAPGAELIVMKVFGALPGSSKITTTDAIVLQAVNKAIADRVDVISLSLGAPRTPETQEVWDKILKRADDEGINVVAATGNAGSLSPSIPAAGSHAIPIGATDTNDRRAAFSQGFTGLNLGFMAPGVATKSAGEGNSLRTLQGTSMATPHAAGSAALVRAAVGRRLSRSELGEILKKTSTKLTGGFPQVGDGRIDVFAAVSYVGGNPDPPNKPDNSDAVRRIEKVISSQEDNIKELKSLLESLKQTSTTTPPENVNSDPKIGKEISRIERLLLLERTERRLEKAVHIEKQQTEQYEAAKKALQQAENRHKKARAERAKSQKTQKEALDSEQKAATAWEENTADDNLSSHHKDAREKLKVANEDLKIKTEAERNANTQFKASEAEVNETHAAMKHATDEVNKLKGQFGKLEEETAIE